MSPGSFKIGVGISNRYHRLTPSSIYRTVCRKFAVMFPVQLHREKRLVYILFYFQFWSNLLLVKLEDEELQQCLESDVKELLEIRIGQVSLNFLLRYTFSITDKILFISQSIMHMLQYGRCGLSTNTKFNYIADFWFYFTFSLLLKQGYYLVKAYNKGFLSPPPICHYCNIKLLMY